MNLAAILNKHAMKNISAMWIILGYNSPKINSESRAKFKMAKDIPKNNKLAIDKIICLKRFLNGSTITSVFLINDFVDWSQLREDIFRQNLCISHTSKTFTSRKSRISKFHPNSFFKGKYSFWKFGNINYLFK